jgi:predicted small secreted protein
MKKTQIKLVILLLTSALWMVFGASCGNTVRGAGKDIRHAGDEIQQSVK